MDAKLNTGRIKAMVTVPLGHKNLPEIRALMAATLVITLNRKGIFLNLLALNAAKAADLNVKPDELGFTLPDGTVVCNGDLIAVMASTEEALKVFKAYKGARTTTVSKPALTAW